MKFAGRFLVYRPFYSAIAGKLAFGVITSDQSSDSRGLPKMGMLVGTVFTLISHDSLQLLLQIRGLLLLFTVQTDGQNPGLKAPDFALRLQ